MREFVIEQLQTLDSRYGYTSSNDKAWIRCPFHRKNGHMEKTPSFMINLEESYKYPVGSYHCFGCGESGSWNELAKLLSLAMIDQDDQISVGSLSMRDKDDLFKVETDTLKMNSVSWDPNIEWRGINGNLIHKIGGLLTVDSYLNDTQLFLPCYMNKKYKGGINCRIKREKWQKGYINTGGEWASKALFPYDYTSKLLRKIEKKCGKRVLFLCEGPRDSLNCLQNGIPAVSILGTQNWSNYKRDLILSMDLDLLVLAFDSDESGIMCRDKVYKQLKGQLDMKKISFKDNKDPADLTPAQCKKYKKKLGILV